MLVVIAALVLLAVGFSACGKTSDPVISPPANGIFFGAKAGPSQEAVDVLETTLKRRLAIRETVFSWEAEWPDARMVADHREGRVPLVSWRGTKVSAIGTGQYDAMIRERAQGARALGFPIFLRPMHEMNGTWYPWCCDPVNYRKAWRRIHSIFDEEGATNVAWVWSPTASVGGWRKYYPGDDYADWIGVSAYNWGTTREPWTWRSLADILGPFYADFGDGDKPIMLAEVASVEQGGDKAAWVLGGAKALEGRFPNVKAWVHQEYTDGEADWRIESSDASLNAYRRVTRDPYFRAFAPN
jgi:endoglucanase